VGNEGLVTRSVAPSAPARTLAAPVTFRSKFLVPLLVPLAVAATIVFYILNVSRVFLANGDALAVAYAAVITVAILAGGSALAAAPKLRSSSITLMLVGAFLVLLMGGLISIGAASSKAATATTQCAPVTQKIVIDAGVNNRLSYTPADPTVKAGCIQITMNIVTSSHTLQFDDPVAANAFRQLGVDLTSWAAVLPPGTYKFHCTIPTHEAGGMVGVLTVEP